MQKGFIQLTLSGYIMLGLSIIVLGLGIALKIQSLRLESANSKLATIEALGLEAQKQKLAQEARDKLKKEVSDNELKKLRLANSDLVKRLRSNANSVFVPRTEASTGVSDLACFDTDKLDGAIQQFAEHTAGLIESGQSAITELNNAKSWASQ